MTYAATIDGAAMKTEMPVDAAGLCNALIEQRQYTLALYADLPHAYWEPRAVPFRATINPPLWELAHIAWFQEMFAMRWRVDDVAGLRILSCLVNADLLFDSARVPHWTRWQLDYPAKATCLDYMQRVLDGAIDALCKSENVDLYGFQLALVHEDMHAEALAMALVNLGLPLPDVAPERAQLSSHFPGPREIAVTGGNFILGANTANARAFSFDNEMPAHIEKLAPFVIDARVVSAAEFAAFATASDYRDARLWSVAGNAWRARTPRKVGDGERAENFAAMRIAYFEAEAYCRWAQRRLPTEMEWEFAATSSVDFLASTGHVWEWTVSPFAPYAGFRAGRYREYSEPWFSSHGVLHRVLKGGSFITHPRLKYPQYRNFYTPERDDIFCGFRTCAIV